jgi:hypothetical protein
MNENSDCSIIELLYNQHFTREQRMNTFTDAYITAIYFTETGDGEQPSSEIKMSEDARARAYADCFTFQSVNATILAEAYDREGYDEGRAGHDFWLTRNGHGAGYWDRAELEADDLGDRLTEAAKLFGECWTTEGDDGLLYLN